METPPFCTASPYQIYPPSSSTLACLLPRYMANRVDCPAYRSYTHRLQWSVGVNNIILSIYLALLYIRDTIVCHFSDRFIQYPRRPLSSWNQPLTNLRVSESRPNITTLNALIGTLSLAFSTWSLVCKLTERGSVEIRFNSYCCSQATFSP